MISVIIPIASESETIGDLVEAALADPDVDEVIVVDDGSVEATVQSARDAGARVLTSSFLGKGASLKDGVKAANNKYIVFLDANIKKLPADAIRQLTEPLIDEKVRLTKARVSGSTGPVCTLTARPLMRTFFPELNYIEFPLTGIWAARRSLLQKLTFESDYGVEVGVLLDAFHLNANIQQVDIGKTVLKVESAELLEEIAVQVTRSILDRAARENRLKPSHLFQVEENIREEEEADPARTLPRADGAERIALFDMDGVLVRGNFILELAYELEKGADLANYLDDPDLDGDKRTEKIAALFSGVPREKFEEVAQEIPLMPGARETVAALRKKGYLVGIVSESFQIAAEIIRCRVLADFSVANLLKFKRGKATGRVAFAPAFSHADGCLEHPHCKANTIPYLAESLGVSADNILAVGNSEDDACLLQAAGQSVAFRPTHPTVRAAAQHILDGALSDLLGLLEGQLVYTP